MIGAPTTKKGKNLVRKLLKEQSGLCAICGLPANVTNANLDHREPKGAGGSNSLRNLQAAHVVCNSEKGCKPRPNKNDLRRAMEIVRNAPLKFSSAQINLAARKKPR